MTTQVLRPRRYAPISRSDRTASTRQPVWRNARMIASSGPSSRRPAMDWA